MREPLVVIFVPGENIVHQLIRKTYLFFPDQFQKLVRPKPMRPGCVNGLIYAHLIFPLLAAVFGAHALSLGQLTEDLNRRLSSEA